MVMVMVLSPFSCSRKIELRVHSQGVMVVTVREKCVIEG